MKYIKYFELFKDKYFDKGTSEYNNLPDNWVWGSKGDLDLSNYDSALNYAYLHGDPHLFKDKQLDMTSKDSHGLTIEQRIRIYMDEYKKVSLLKEVNIFRTLKLESIDKLDTNNIGSYWSFRKEGAGTYGSGRVIEPGKKYQDESSYLLTGLVSTNSIDWELGFFNFLTYSLEQFECYVKKGSQVLITGINDKIVDIKAII